MNQTMQTSQPSSIDGKITTAGSLILHLWKKMEPATRRSEDYRPSEDGAGNDTSHDSVFVVSVTRQGKLVLRRCATENQIHVLKIVSSSTAIRYCPDGNGGWCVCDDGRNCNQ